MKRVLHSHKTHKHLYDPKRIIVFSFRFAFFVSFLVWKCHKRQWWWWRWQVKLFHRKKNRFFHLPSSKLMTSLWKQTKTDNNKQWWVMLCDVIMVDITFSNGFRFFGWIQRTKNKTTLFNRFSCFSLVRFEARIFSFYQYLLW